MDLSGGLGRGNVVLKADDRAVTELCMLVCSYSICSCSSFLPTLVIPEM